MKAPGSSTNEDRSIPARDAIEATAANWIARRNGGGLSSDEERELYAWIAADPSHTQTWQEMEAAWGVLQEPRQRGFASAVSAHLACRQRRRRQRATAWAGLGLAAAAAFAVMIGPPVREQPSLDARAPSIAVRPDRRVLSDGSSVELNAGAEIAVEFAANRRGVRLMRGEAMFSIVRDPTRPFVVQAGGVEVRAVGTAFAVRHDERQVSVLVTEGKVAVERRPDTAPPLDGSAPEPVAPVLVGGGGAVEIPLDGPATAPLQLRAVSNAVLAAALAWRDKRIEFSDTPLAEAIEVFNRHNVVQLEISDAAVARRRVTGIFWADDPEGFVRLLETGFGIHAERAGETVRLRRH